MNFHSTSASSVLPAEVVNRNAASTLVQLVPRRRPTSRPWRMPSPKKSVGADVFERQEPTGLDLEDLGNVDDFAEGALDAVGVGDHREEGVDALNL